MGDMGSMMGPGMMGPGWMTVAMVSDALLGLALLTLVILGILAGLRWLARGSAGPATPASLDPALSRLRERYARGEITRDEFRQVREDLTERMTSVR